MFARPVTSFVLCSCLSWVACVGSDPAAPAAGERLGSCLADGGCGEGLTCRDGICVSTDAPEGGGTVPDAGDAATEAGLADASSDAEALRCGLATTTGVMCPDAPCTDPLHGCCIDRATGVHTCATNCPGEAKRFECDSPAECGNGTRCCAQLAPEQGGVACPSRVSVSLSYCIDTCPDRVVCRIDADCTGAENRCVLTEAELLPGVVHVWGFCAR